MASFQEQLNDNSYLLDQNAGFGQSVTYTPVSGSPSTITVVVERHEEIALGVHSDGMSNNRTVYLYAAVADVPTPQIKDIFNFDAADWVVMGNPETEYNLRKLLVQRSETFEKSAQEYRNVR